MGEIIDELSQKQIEAMAEPYYGMQRFANEAHLKPARRKKKRKYEEQQSDNDHAEKEPGHDAKGDKAEDTVNKGESGDKKRQPVPSIQIQIK